MAQSGTYHFPAVGESNYVKLFDGTMIQWGRTSVTIAADTTNASAVVTYPAAFHESTGAPIVVVSTSEPGAGTSTQANVSLPTVTQAGNADTGLTAFTLRVWRQVSAGTAGNPDPVVAWVAFGRWKA